MKQNWFDISQTGGREDTVRDYQRRRRGEREMFHGTVMPTEP